MGSWYTLTLDMHYYGDGSWPWRLAGYDAHTKEGGVILRGSIKAQDDPRVALLIALDQAREKVDEELSHSDVQVPLWQ